MPENADATLSVKEVMEELRDAYSACFENTGITSFSMLESVSEDDDLMDNIEMVFAMAYTMLFNIKNSDSPNKLEEVKTLLAELSEMVDSVVQVTEENTMTEETDDKACAGKKRKRGMMSRVKSLFTDMLSKAAPAKTEGGVAYPASDFLYVPDPKKPSTWKLRIAEGKPGNVTVAQLGRAAAAFSSGGFRGNKVEMPSGEMASVKRKLRAAYKKLGVATEDIPESIRKESPFMVWKDNQSGKMRWFAFYSNNYIDDDFPREIISKESHQNFVEMVDRGEVEYPELWHWHVPGTAWGKADWVAFDDETGMAMASGYIYDGHEKEAEELAVMTEMTDIGVSHGMPKMFIARDESNPNVIVKHVTREISDLPLSAAANKLTGFNIFEEKQMAIPENKKEYLKQVGLSDEDIQRIEESNVSKSRKAQELQLESKEQESAVTDESPAAEAVAEVKDAEVSETEPVVEEKSATVEFVTKEAFTSAVEKLVDLLGKGFDDLNAAVKEMNVRISDVETKQSEAIPPASIAAMLSRQMTATAAPENKLNKNSTLAKEKPAETEVTEETHYSDNPVADTIMRAVLGGK